MRARKLTTGTAITIDAVRKGKAKIVFLATDASLNTKKLVNDKCFTYNVKVIEIMPSNELSTAIGKNNIKVIGVIDEGFSKLLLDEKRK